LLFLLGLGVAAAVAIWQQAPGYMDADYYFALGRELARGHGFWQPFLWNFLDDPTGLPHPSHGYWPPLASLLSALSLRLVGGDSFAAGRLGALVTAASLPPLTAAIGFTLEPRRSLALLAGALAAFSGFYAAFLPTTDTFGIVMLLGGATALLLVRPQPAPRRFFLVGIV
jgi:hypothetical protein